MLYEKKEVLKFLPHRDPFLFVDSIVSVSNAEMTVPRSEASFKDLVGTDIHAKYTTREDHPIFQGHFPGHPILPGVVQVEMMAQAAGFVLHLIYDDITKLNIDVALLSVSSAKFRKPIYPGMELDIFTHCTRIRGSMISTQCSIKNNGEIMSQAEVMASVKS